MINRILVKLLDNQGTQFYIGLILGPLGLAILDLFFGNDK